MRTVSVPSLRLPLKVMVGEEAAPDTASPMMPSPDNILIDEQPSDEEEVVEATTVPTPTPEVAEPNEVLNVPIEWQSRQMRKGRTTLVHTRQC